MKFSNLSMMIMIILMASACTRPLMNTSKSFVDLQQGVEKNTIVTNDIARKVDELGTLQRSISKHLGLNTDIYDQQKFVSSESKELMAFMKDYREEAKKDREANNEILKTALAALKVVGPVAGQMIGIPPQVTTTGLTLTESLIGAGGLGLIVNAGKDFLARRKTERDDQEWQDHCDKLAEEHDLKLQEVKKKGLIKAHTMALMDPAMQEVYDQNELIATEKLRRKGLIS